MFNYSEVKNEVQKREKELRIHSADFRKKDTGCYYTPQFIVNYIVDSALSYSLADKLTKDKDEKELIFVDLKNKKEITKTNHATLLIEQILPNFSICDISMGWGVFVLRAFDYLVCLYKSCFRLLEDELPKLLSTKFPSEEDVAYYIVSNIISNNIFGVDLAEDSVNLAFFKTIEKALQTLKKDEIYLPKPNYYVGNCLVGKIKDNYNIHEKNFKDSFIESLISSLNKDERIKSKEWLEKIYMIHWSLCFPKIFESGGFDVVVGNPPYINVKRIELGERRIYLKLYEAYNPSGDISNVFWERSLKLCKKNGIISLITPRYWLEGNYSNSLRDYILRNSSIREIIDFRSNRSLFTQTEDKLGVDTAIVTLQKGKSEKNLFDVYLSTDNSPIKEIITDSFKRYTISQSFLSGKKWVFEKHSIIDKLEDRAKHRLGDDKRDQDFTGICEIGKGCSTGNNRIFKLTQKSAFVFEGAEGEELFLEKHEKNTLHRLVKNSDIKRYWWKKRNQYWLFLKDRDIEDYFNIKKYLEKYKPVLERTQKKYKLKNYYDYAAYRSLSLINHSPKIICPYQSSKNRFSLQTSDKEKTIYETDVITIVLKKDYERAFDWYYILAVLNSEIMNYYARIMNKKVFNLIDFRTNQLAPIPIMQCKNQQIIKHFVKNLLTLKSLRQHDSSKWILQGIKLHKDILNDLIFEIYLRKELGTSLASALEEIVEEMFLFNISAESILTNYNQLSNLIINERKSSKNIEKITNHPEVKSIKKYLALN